ncbi:hypothetical protein [Desmospora profundinema]|uniref:Uncharacterized protein n=1 Tax=Desmospora profundinema TaxID=1571184 RepID=A0ABU1ILA2_9BACL|nr:hypothetical protein [Desmospora profundinema]MDR6224729.1 hypothetical protein [Desmospora profundinema]
MKKTFTKFFIALLSMLVLVTTSTVNISAAQSLNIASNENLDKVESICNDVFDNIIEVDEDTQQRLLNKAQDHINSGKVKYKSSNDLVFKNPSVRGVKYDDGTITYSVSFNYTDEETRLNALNIVFDNKEELLNTFEVDIKKLSEDEASVNYWVDGKEHINQNVDISEYVASEEAEKAPQFSAMSKKSWSSCMQKCLAGKGMTMLAITLLGVLCGASCTVGVPATAGTACYACVNTAGMIGATAFMNCWEQKCKRR